MTDVKNDEIHSTTGFLNRSVTCRIAKAGLEVLRDGHTTLIGYDGFTEIRFDRRGSGRAVLIVKTSEGTTTTLRFVPEAAAAMEIDDFVKSLIDRVGHLSPKTRFVIGPSQTQWVASWGGLFASGAVLAATAWSVSAGGQLGSVLLPVGVALVNLAVVLPILRSGRPRRYTAADAISALS
jgi:hypothetical protein